MQPKRPAAAKPANHLHEVDEATMLHDDDVPPHKEAIHHHEDGHGDGGHGGSEMGWLVSYADMMTLLFGLFVILFSLAHDTSKSVEETMRQVSDKYFRDAGPAPTPSKTPEKSPEKKDPPPTETLQKEITDLKAAMDGQQSEFQKKIDEMKTESEKTQAEKQEIEASKAAVESEKQALESKLADLETEMRRGKHPEIKKPDPSAKLKSEVEALQRKLASVEETKSKSDSEKTSAVTKAQADVEALKKELAATKAQNEKMQKELASSSKAPQSYMMVLLSWETEKHDLDLQVVDPRKKSFNFKKRQNKGEPGQFELDSRFGPGIEMWKSTNFVAGAYRAQVSLYAQNGNETPAKARITVITNLNTYISDPIEIAKKGENRDIGFDVQSDGSVVFKGTAP